MADDAGERPSLLKILKTAWQEAGREVEAREARPAPPEPEPERPRPAAARTGPIRGPRLTGPMPASAEAEQESQARLRFIMAYMKDPTSDPDFADKPLVYRILAAERSFQQNLIQRLRRELALLPPPAAAMGLDEADLAGNPEYTEIERKREAANSALEQALKYQGYIFQLMKDLTGIRGKTGGTDFLGRS